jgi:Nucleotidyltransferase domain
VDLPAKPVSQPGVDGATLRAPLEKRGLLPDDTMAAFCGGSIARGWANEGSDYDVYIVTAAHPQGDPTLNIPVPLQPDIVPVRVITEDRRFEIKYWTDGQIDQMLDKVSQARFEQGLTAEPLMEAEEVCLERLLTCVPIAGDDWLARRRADVQQSAFREYMVVRSLAAAEKSVEDAVGQLRSRDVYSAVLSSQLAIGRTVDALLESVGCFGTRTQKWRARRMLDAAPAALPFEEFWALMTMADLDPANPEPWVRHVVSWCQRMALDIEI